MRAEYEYAIFNIDMITNELNRHQQEIVSSKVIYGVEVQRTILRRYILDVCSLLEEWEVLEKYSTNIPKLKEALTWVDPFLQNAKSYTEIKEVRNSLIAHFNRDRRKAFYPWWLRLKDKNAPFSTNEVDFIMMNLTFAANILCSEYYNIIEDITKEIHHDYHDYNKEANSRDENGIKQNLLQKLMTAQNEVEKRIGNKELIKLY